MKAAFEDKFLLSELYNLIDKFNIKKIIETGSYKGWSTSILSKTGLIIESIELNKDYFDEAKEKNKFDNVTFFLGPSEIILENILYQEQKNLLFFLDAHWGEHWPLLDELNIISRKKIKPVIIIHDFFVPDQNGNPKFGFDQYQNQKLDYEYVKQNIEKIYDNQFEHYCLHECDLSINSGVGIFIPKLIT